VPHNAEAFTVILDRLTSDAVLVVTQWARTLLLDGLEKFDTAGNRT